jgi:hypothetical protein
MSAARIAASLRDWLSGTAVLPRPVAARNQTPGESRHGPIDEY